MLAETRGACEILGLDPLYIANEGKLVAFCPRADADKVLAAIRAQYTIGYLSTDDRADGAWRKVEIKVTRKDGRDYRIRSRKGYFAPYKNAPAKPKL